MVIDGGLATALERRGHDLRSALWSAELLLEAPDEVAAVHRTYLEAGADCIATASYQATIPGFVSTGLSEAAARELLRISTGIAVRERDRFWSAREHPGRRRPLVAASVGPYGAYLADGSEYTGDYDLDRAGLVRFHVERLGILAASGADLLAFETIPNATEAEVLLELLEATPGVWAWMSLSCENGGRLRDGTAVADVARACDTVERVAAVGVNCTAPEHVVELIGEIRRETDKPIVVYPNSGETYDAGAKAWTGGAAADWTARCESWVEAGARLVGGCCRVGAEEIRRVRERLLPS